MATAWKKEAEDLAPEEDNEKWVNDHAQRRLEDAANHIDRGLTSFMEL